MNLMGRALKSQLRAPNCSATLSETDYVTNNVLLFEGKSPLNCCVIGYHGTR